MNVVIHIHKFEIEFESSDLPRQLPPDVSLCLFRVLQEALHNAAKHSGVRRFEVELWGTSDGDVVVWGTSGGDVVVWGTACTDSSCEPMIWNRQ